MAGGLATGVTCVLVALSVPSCLIPISETGGTDAGPKPAVDGSTLSDGAPSDGASRPDGAIPPAPWVNASGNLANMSSQCGNMSFLSAKPDEDLLIAGIALDGLWGSRNGGQTWSPLSQASDASAPITNRTSAIVYDPTTSTRFWESGLYNGPAGYETSDDGTTFTQFGLAESSDLVSVDFTDPNRQTLLLGGHEQSQTLYRSTDGGNTWTAVGSLLPPNTNCTFPVVIDAQTHLVGCGGYGGGVSGIYRTTDGAATWMNVSSLGGWHAPLLASDGSIYWSSPNGAGIARSTDQGQTWTSTVTTPNTVGSYSPIELPDGRIATIGPVNPPQYVMLSADKGVTWTIASSALPYSDAVGVAYSSQEKAFYVWHFTCPSSSGVVPVPSDAVMSFAFDYQTN